MTKFGGVFKFGTCLVPLHRIVWSSWFRSLLAGVVCWWIKGKCVGGGSTLLGVHTGGQAASHSHILCCSLPRATLLVPPMRTPARPALPTCCSAPAPAALHAAQMSEPQLEDVARWCNRYPDISVSYEVGPCFYGSSCFLVDRSAHWRELVARQLAGGKPLL